MMQLITPDWYEAFSQDLEDMYRLRYRVFKERLDWNVHTVDGLEIDQFDEMKPDYLLLRNAESQVAGCVRLLPSVGPTMLRDAFPALLDGQTAPESPDVWESSRFALDPVLFPEQSRGGLAAGTYELFAGVLEFGLARKLNRIVTVTDIRMERILRRAGWPLERIGSARDIGNTRAIAGFLEISAHCLETVGQIGGLKGPVLWAPVASDAA